MAAENPKQLTDRQVQDIFDEYESATEQGRTPGKAGSRPAMPQKARPKFASIQGATPEEFIRIRLPNPKNREVLGLVVEDFGKKLLVKCSDGFTRNCRIPGKIRYKVYINPGDTVLIQKWVVQEKEKGDYLYKYTRTQVSNLIKKGYLKEGELQ